MLTERTAINMYSFSVSMNPAMVAAAGQHVSIEAVSVLAWREALQKRCRSVVSKAFRLRVGGLASKRPHRGWRRVSKAAVKGRKSNREKRLRTAIKEINL